jgi:hypothetical protein
LDQVFNSKIDTERVGLEGRGCVVRDGGREEKGKEEGGKEEGAGVQE